MSFLENNNKNTILINIQKIVDFVYLKNFKNILIKDKSEFINDIENQILDIIKCYYKDEELEYQKELNLYEKEKDKIRTQYENDFSLINSEYLKYKNNNNKTQYLKRFRKHCVNLDQIPLHKCSSNKQGKLIEIFIKNNNKYNHRAFASKKFYSINSHSYVVCTGCSLCFVSTFIRMYCPNCKTEYFSSKLDDNENENILPATWKDYHCKPIIVNEVMKCIKCENILYINLLTKKLVCLNKKCNFTSESQNIIWRCKICQKDFTSSAKIFNPLENKILYYEVFKSLIYREPCIPQRLYCCCYVNKKAKYSHNKKCKGELYKGTVEGKPIVVCSQCHAVNFYEKFIWNCPLCGIRFYYNGLKYKKEVDTNEKDKITKNMNNHRILSSFEKYRQEKKMMIDKNNLYNNPDNSREKSHRHNFSSNIRLLEKNLYNNIKTIPSNEISNTLEYNRNTFDTKNIIPKCKYIKKKNKIKYKTLYDILEEREKHKINKSNKIFDNVKKQNQDNEIQKTQTSIQKDKNSMLQNYFTLSENRRNKKYNFISNNKINNYVNEGQNDINEFSFKMNDIINASNSEELLYKYNENNKIYDYDNKNLQKKESKKLNYFSKFGIYGYGLTDSSKDIGTTNLTMDEKDKNNNIFNYSKFGEKTKDNILNYSKESPNRRNIRKNISQNKEVENDDNHESKYKQSRFRKYLRSNNISNIKESDKIMEKENDNYKANDVNENSLDIKVKIYDSNKLKKSQIFKKIFLNKIDKNLSPDENNEIKEENEINFEDNQINDHNMGICQFGDLEESLVSKDDFMKISRECKIPSFDEKNIIYIKPIGQGSFGVIYLIEEKNTKKQYALKSVLCNDIEQILKHKKEFELLYSLNHPNLIKIYNVLFKYLDMTTYILYVLMEKADTDWNNEIEIRSKMKRNYTEKELINIMKQLVNVLLYFQKNNLAHRDIKPQNILIFPNNVYKVSDLGEAKNTKNNIQYATLKGNQFFMSPNLFFAFKYSGNSQKVKHNVFKSDVFSLGYCFLYAMSLDLRLIKILREKTLIDDVILIIKQFGLESKYSTKFMNIIYKMIQTDENKRFDFIELNEEINKNFS